MPFESRAIGGRAKLFAQIGLFIKTVAKENRFRVEDSVAHVIQSCIRRLVHSNRKCGDSVLVCAAHEAVNDPYLLGGHALHSGHIETELPPVHAVGEDERGPLLSCSLLVVTSAHELEVYSLAMTARGCIVVKAEMHVEAAQRRIQNTGIDRGIWLA